MSETGLPGQSLCSLPGCGEPITQPTGGGRPRLYCSDGHRAEARRRRLAAGRGGDTAVELLGEALRQLQADPGPAVRTAALLAEVRAQATADVLAAQREAAAARREAMDADRQLGEQRVLIDALEGRLATLRDQVGELQAALDGARDALEAEVVQHHQDVQAADHRTAAMAAIHRQQQDAAAAELDRYRVDAVAAEARRAAAEDRAERAERDAAQAGRTASHLELRAHQAEMAAEQVESRLQQARDDLAAERRRSEALERDLRRRLTPSPPPAGRARRRYGSAEVAVQLVGVPPPQGVAVGRHPA
ncbi:MAG TPA: hypothetical protein VHB02_16225 [Acidimicrobiales bacterium]|nr:hypothetical protein [Acidimicrobiales bacterium]